MWHLTALCAWFALLVVPVQCQAGSTQAALANDGCPLESDPDAPNPSMSLLQKKAASVLQGEGTREVATKTKESEDDGDEDEAKPEPGDPDYVPPEGDVPPDEEEEEPDEAAEEDLKLPPLPARPSPSRGRKDARAERFRQAQAMAMDTAMDRGGFREGVKPTGGTRGGIIAGRRQVVWNPRSCKRVGADAGRLREIGCCSQALGPDGLCAPGTTTCVWINDCSAGYRCKSDNTCVVSSPAEDLEADIETRWKRLYAAAKRPIETWDAKIWAEIGRNLLNANRYDLIPPLVTKILAKGVDFSPALVKIIPSYVQQLRTQGVDPQDYLPDWDEILFRAQGADE